jgi:hypothetical protein
MPTLAQFAASTLLAACASAQCISLGTFVTQGNVPTNLQPNGSGTEISGIVASRHNPGVLWVHDDSGNAAQLIALRANGSLARQYTLPTTNRDWEDLALGPGPIAGRGYLYIADIGNNALGYTTFRLLRIAEPDVPPGSGPPIALPAPDVFSFHYPIGTWNAETLWIDPFDGTPYVLTKVDSSTCSLFRYPMPLDAGQDKALVHAATLTNMPVTFTGGAISADGRWIFARSYTVIHAWSRPLGSSFAAALQQPPCAFANSQGQAEAIAVAADGSALWAVSENNGAALRKAPIGWPAGAPVAYAFGTGLTGGTGIPALGSPAAPRLGGPAFQLAAWQVPPNAPALCLLSLTGLDDGVFPWMGGSLHAVPDQIVGLAASADGTLTVAFPALADDPALRRLPVHGQIVSFDAQAVQGYGLSRGLRLVLDR